MLKRLLRGAAIIIDADKWITVHPNGAGTVGAPVKIDAETGEVKAGLGGKFTGKNISQVQGKVGRPNSRASAHAAFSPPPSEAPAKTATPQSRQMGLPEMASGHARLKEPLKIKKETAKAYGVPNPDYERAKELHRYGGDLEVMRRGFPAEREAWAEKQSLRWMPKGSVTVHEGSIVGMPPWLAEKYKHAVEPDKAAEQKKRDDDFAIHAPDYAPKLSEGHVRIAEPRKVLKETGQAVAIENRRKTPRFSDEYRWLPKSATTVEHGHVVGFEPWVAEKHGFALHAPDAEKVKAAAAEKAAQRTYLNVPFSEKERAKKLGAKWDPDKRQWFHPGGEMPEGLARYGKAQPATSQAAVAPKPTGGPTFRIPMPEKGRIGEDDPSVWGHELLGWEGERWESFRRSDAYERMMERATGTKRPAPAEPSPPEKNWAYSEAAVQRALRGEDAMPNLVCAEDGWDDPDNYPDGRFVMDRGVDVLVVEQVGRTRTLTPEGYLYCEGVRIARTGPMLYTPDEMPDIERGSGAMILVERGAEVLFAPEAIASFNGKPITVQHPEEMVRPETWRSVSAGTVMNVRRGDGIESEYLLADLLITDADAIRSVMKGLAEVSCGYDSDREQVKPGVARMTKVIGNHVALVDKGRCGPSCAINDHEGTPMASKRSVWDRMRTAFRANDAAAFEEEVQNAMTGAEGGGEGSPPVVVHVHNAAGDKPASQLEAPAKDEGETDPMAAMAKAIEAIGARLDALERRANDKEPDGDESRQPATDEGPAPEDADDKDKSATMDSASMRDEFQDALARAEVLAPGIKMPVFDGRAKRKATFDAMCDLRRRALTRALGDDTRKTHVLAVIGPSTDISKMTCDAAAMAFRAASELARAANNKPGVADLNPLAGQRMTPAKLQELNVARRKAGA